MSQHKLLLRLLGAGLALSTTCCLVLVKQMYSTNQTRDDALAEATQEREARGVAEARLSQAHQLSILWRDLLAVPTELPEPQRLPAVGGPANFRALRWSEAFVVAEVASGPPSAVALDRDRIAVHWPRPASGGAYTYHLMALQLRTRMASTSVRTGGGTNPAAQACAQTLAPLGPNQCFVVDHDDQGGLAGHVGTLHGLIVSVSPANKLGWVGGNELDLFRLSNGLFLVGGLGLGGAGRRSGLGVVACLSNGRLCVLRRYGTSAGTYRSLLGSRNTNRVGVVHSGGLEVLSVDYDGALNVEHHLDVGSSEGTGWTQGFGVDLGDGRVVQVLCGGPDTRLLCVDLSGGAEPNPIVGRAWPHAAQEGGRRGCCVGGQLVLCRRHMVEVFDTRPADAKAWSCVVRNTLEDLAGGGTPCVIGESLVLVYTSASQELRLRSSV